jgi:hypothetical protein
MCVEMGVNSGLPSIGALYENVELRAGLHADVAVPNGDGPHPVVVYLHGGGWMAGSPTTHRKLGMQFAEQGYVTVNVSYRLAPENPFPDGFDDCVFAAKWARDNVHRWNGDPSRMAMGPRSACRRVPVARASRPANHARPSRGRWQRSSPQGPGSPSASVRPAHGRVSWRASRLYAQGVGRNPEGRRYPEGNGQPVVKGS